VAPEAELRVPNGDCVATSLSVGRTRDVVLCAFYRDRKNMHLDEELHDPMTT
jgi:hypothetical protein